MTVMFVDKRRSNERFSSVELSNGFWFKCLDLDGMGKLINTQHSNDEINTTPAKSKKIAQILTTNKHKLIEYQNDELVLDCLIEFMVNCNGFRTY